MTNYNRIFPTNSPGFEIIYSAYKSELIGLANIVCSNKRSTYLTRISNYNGFRKTVIKKSHTKNVSKLLKKGGVINMTRELAVELAPEGIYVNCICPGIIETPLYKDIDFPLDDKENLEYTLKAIPMKKIGMPGDIAGAAFFFASEDSSFVTGQILAVDGGYTSI